MDGRNEVHIKCWIENQRGMVISPGEAVVLLPSRKTGPVVLPKPPSEDPVDLLRHEVRRLAEEEKQ